MVDSFKGSDVITIQPNDNMVPYNFIFTVCSSTTKNDGALPHDETISFCTVTAHSEAGTALTTSSEFVYGTLSGFTETVQMSYTTSLSDGRYHLQFIVGLTASSQTMEFDFKRIQIKNA